MSKNTNLSFLTDYITADITNGRIGINTPSPTVAFDVTGVAKFSSSVNVQNFLTVSGATTLVAPTSGKSIEMVYRLDGANDYAFIQAYDRTASVLKRLDLNASMTILPSGNVGIGTSSPDTNLTVWGANVANNTASGNITIYTTTAYGANVGGSIGLGGYYNATTGYIPFGNIYGKKENGTLDDSNGYLGFSTRNSSAGTVERMRITSAGNVGIGNTAFANTRLTITGISTTSSNYGLVVNNSSNANLFAIRDDGNIYLNSSVYNSQTVGVPRTLYISSIEGNYIGGLVSIRESKKNIENIKDVNWLYKLNPVTYNYRKKDENGNFTEEIFNEIVYGLIAEDTASIADFLVNYNDKEDGSKEMLGIEYPRLITPMLKAIQELKAEIETLKNK